MPLVTPEMYIHQLDLHLGFEYGFSDRCGGSYHEHDCSGYMCWAMNALGLYIGCLSSFVMANLCYDNGLGISIDEARKTPATWAFHGPNGGRGPSHRAMGADGHIVCSAGDGTTREARGHAYGVIVGPFDGRGWDGAAKIPGITYTPQTIKKKVDPMLFLDKLHPATKPNRARSASVQPDGTIWLGNGSNLKGAGADKLQWVFGIRVLTPPSRGRPFAGAAEHGANGFLLQFVQEDGTFADFNYQFTL